MCGQQPRIAGPVDDAARLNIAHSHLPLRSATDLGAVSDAQQFGRMILVLSRSPEQQQALAAFLDS